MKHMHWAAALTAAAALAAPAAHAGGIDSVYTNLGGNLWAVDFTLVNDGTPAVPFAGFTIDFLQATQLTLVQSPAAWDSLVVQPDANIPDSGFLDSLALTPSAALGAGGSLGGFRVTFTWTGSTPGALPFLIHNGDNVPVLAGMTSVVPEPAAAWLMAAGLCAAALRSARRKPRAVSPSAPSTSSEVTA